eukprot:Transcript_14612.p1 GENE.Transcript_14612~~Transcript_14612.p1  ORF type:complete len:299 (-),score=81.58 Transcript_14612:285-1181(-)
MSDRQRLPRGSVRPRLPHLAGLCGHTGQYNASTCPCSSGGCNRRRVDCSASLLCSSDLHSLSEPSPSLLRSAAIVTVLDVRTSVDPKLAGWQFAAMLRLLHSLQNVSTSLPIYTLATRAPRIIDEPALRALGARVRYVDRSRIPVPRWAASHPYHAGTFIKLLLLDPEVVPVQKLVFLDNDCLAVRNLDHLALQPAPSFVFHRADFGPNSGVMVLEPSAEAARRVRDVVAAQQEGRIITAPGAAVAGAGDYSDQNVWSELYAEVRAGPCVRTRLRRACLHHGHRALTLKAHAIFPHLK